MGPTALPKSIENDGCSFTTAAICKCVSSGDLSRSNDSQSGFPCGNPNKKTADRPDAVVGDPEITLSAHIAEKPGKNLTELRLSGQGLKSFPETDDLSSLVTLDLSQNEIPDIPSKLLSSTHLRVLNLSHNCLTEFPKVLLDGLAVLKTLNLSFNTLNKLPRPACVQHLIELTARSCKLTEFPPWILFERHCIETLDLSINPIFDQYLPDERSVYHSSVRTLKKINLSNTYAFERIRVLFAQFTGLEHVDVSNYRLRYCNRILSGQELLGPSLRVLKAVNVGLAASPSLEICSQLEVVNLGRNPMSWINSDFPVKSLRIAILPNSFICILPDNFGDMINLEYLNLSHNDLSALPASFNKLTRLKHVDLYRNSFSEFPEELQSLKQITCLDICMNYFETPSHPLGDDVASYEELRGALRATLTEERSSGGLAKPSNDVYLSDDGSGRYKRFESSSSSSSIDSDEENGERSEKSVFIRPLPVSQPDEDWDVLEPPTSLSDYHFSDRGLQHPFVPEFTETCDLNVHFMQYLQLVPERIRNSPFYYHRIDTSASSKRSSVRKFSKVDIAEGQFDD
uniref:Adenylate cyclase n=2 Tax=Lygus hesperus TaxID=30085 RepID=A0A146LFC0_LYGHE